jgi:hypothetical protein
MSQSCVYLPRAPVKAYQFKLHISYFLQKCKKAKPKNEICPSDIQKHNVFEIMPGRDKLQVSIIAPYPEGESPYLYIYNK